MTTSYQEAAVNLHSLWQSKTRCSSLPEAVHPRDRLAGYQVQQAFAEHHAVAVAGWKIAATSIEGQRHIGVDGPLAGRLFVDRVLANGASVPLTGNLMRVAEIEFAFCLGQRLAPRAAPYSTAAVMEAVSTMHPSIEIPDSRFENFVTAGAPQLIADNACANLFVLGPGQTTWREFDYINAPIRITQNDAPVDPGFGRNVLGDPRVALTWLVNELSQLGIACEPGQFVTTGTCRVPLTVAPNDRIHGDFGVLGSVSCSFSE